MNHIDTSVILTDIFYSTMEVNVFIVTGDCGAVPVVANGVADANPSLTVGSEVTYQCDVGYEFRTEGVDVYTIECQADDTWTDISDCDCECPMLILV